MKARDVSIAATSCSRGRGAAPRVGSLLPLRVPAFALLALLLSLAFATATAAAAPPTLTINPVPTHSITTATVTGNLEIPAGNDPTNYYYFQYRVRDSEEAWTQTDYQGTVAAGSSVAAEAHLSGLKAATPYEVRLVTVNFGAEGGPERYSANPEVRYFTTDPAPNTPAIVLDPAAEVFYTSAKLSGTVDPEGGNADAVAGPVPVHWVLQTSTSGDPGTWTSAAEGDLADPAGTDPLSVPETPPAEATGLTPGSEYHYRLNVTYAGIDKEQQGTFTTDPVAPPAVSAVQATEVGYVGAHLAGQVDLANDDPAFNASVCRFEYVTQEQFDAEAFAAAEPNGQLASCEPEPAGSGSHAVAAQLSGLKPDTTYHLRLTAANQGGSDSAEAPGTFKTKAVAPPAVSALQAGDLTGTSAHFSANVEVGGADEAFNASCEFNYLTQAQYEAAGNSFDGASSLACAEPISGSAPQPVAVAADAKGLQPNTVYHLRLLATNAGGSAAEATTFGTGVLPPTIGTNVSTPIGPGEVIVRAYVNANNSPITDCHFEYGLDDDYGQTAPCEGHPGDETQLLNVFATAGQFRLGLGGQTTADLAFNASAAEVQTALEALSTIGASNVSVIGGPGGGPDERYRITFSGTLAETDVGQLSVEDGTEALKGKGGITTPIPGGLSTALPVSAQLSGLTPGTDYHFRLLAINAVDTATGPDRLIPIPAEPSTASCPNAGNLGTDRLPDCRAYELVSPPDKNGGDVLIDTARSRAAEDGDAIQFASPIAFGDAVGTGAAVDYMAIRDRASVNGWSTHALTPTQEPLSVNGVTAADPMYVGDLSSDLSRGVFRSWSSLTNDPSVADTPNLYRRDDLRRSDQGSYQLVTPCLLCDQTGTPLPAPFGPQRVPAYAGASKDFRHIVFESRLQLTPDVSEEETPHLFEWEDGVLRFAGYVPSGSDTSCGGTDAACIPATESHPGGTANTNGTSLRRPVNIISDDGRRVFFDANENVYMRTDHTVTDQLNVSERTDCSVVKDGESPKVYPDCAGSPSSSFPQPASYVGASTDGSRVLFISGQALTDDAGEISFQRLYMYDTTKPPADPHNLTLVSRAEVSVLTLQTLGVIGTSDDASYVYFIGRGQRVAGQPLFGFAYGIYSWHNGELAYIGTMVQDDSNELFGSGGNYGTYPPQGRVSPDGRTLVLTAHDGSGLAPYYDHGNCGTSYGRGCREVYVYHAGSHTLACASCQRDRSPATQGKEAATGIRLAAAQHTTWHLNRAVSEDGRFVFFSTPEALLAQDTNGVSDAYEYDSETARLHLLTSGTNESPSYFLEADLNGSDVFVLTRERLSLWDTDTSLDVYDARIDGGLPEPGTVEAPCTGESCWSSAPPPPRVGSAISADLRAPSDPTPTRRHCGRGKHSVKRHGKARCIRRRAKHRRADNADGRHGR